MQLSKLAVFSQSALWAGLVVFPLAAWAGFAPDGLESVKPGHLRGDQTMPAVAINHLGGYLVWQDNTVDGNGMGIRAQRLDAAMAKAGSAFRVNVQPVGDQAQPQLSLLRNGGAVFVWQGGRAGSERIFARFLGANGTFVSGDIRVNTYTNGFQINPAVATLADGSVVVVWSSFGQEGGSQSFQGVYAQRFAPNGTKLGGEFRVNQTSLYNQRTPAVAGLTNGSFVVTWVTELQRGPVSVDVYARIFEANGSPITAEFPVNLNAAKVCANPSITASLLTGGFAIAWSQDDTERFATGSGSGAVPVTTSGPRSQQSWDVMSRVFGPVGNGLTGEILVNQTTIGDQFAPTVRAFGEDFTVLWTSLGQDGSREGIYGRFVDGTGIPAGNEFLVNTTTVSRQIHPAIASDNHSQLLAVWSSFHGNGTGFDLFSQRYLSSVVIPLERITNALPPVVEPNTGLPRLEFPEEAQFGDPVPNAFAVAAGTYQGLFFSKYGVDASSSGSLLIKTTAKGAYSGKLQLGGKTHSFKGSLDDSGWAASVIKRSGNTPLTVYLQVDLSGGDSLRGGVSDGDWWSDLQGDRQVFHKVNHPTASAGNYTVVIRGGSTGPVGEGFATLKVDAGGVISMSGKLADGTKISQKSGLSREGYWPLSVSLNKGAGSLIGWLKFESEATTDLAGEVVWSRRANAAAVDFPAGFSTTREVVGSRYTAPAAGQRVINLPAGKLTLSGGQLPSTLAVPLVIGVNNTVTGDAGLKLSFAARQGTFKGSVTLATGALKFEGVVLQKSSTGGGYFLQTGQSGRVDLTAP